MRKKLLIIIISIILITSISVYLTASIASFLLKHPTHYKYNDGFVIGNTAENIIDRYGEFDARMCQDDGVICRAGYKVKDDIQARLSIFLFGLDDYPWYHIIFKDGIAVSVELSYAWIGG